MEEFLRATIAGLCTAGIYGIAASGLVVTYTTTGIFNFAHGAVGMLAAFSYWQLLAWGVPAVPAVAIVLLVGAPLYGVAIDRVVMRGLADAPEAVRLVVSIALLAASLGLGLWLWPSGTGRRLSRWFDGGLFGRDNLSIAGVTVSWHEALALVLAVVVAVGLRVLLRRTRAGITMRAVVDDRPLASLNGVRPERAGMLAWALGCGLAALAGLLAAPGQGLSHTTLTLLIVNAYAAAMVGRLRSLPLTVLGAAVLGLLNNYSIKYLPSNGDLAPYLAGLRLAMPVLVLLVVLVVLPSATLRAGRTQRRLAAPRPTWSRSLVVGGVLLGGAVLLAVGLSDADALKAAKGVGLALIALSLVPLVGWAGQLCLCTMSFAGIGALCAAHLGHGGNPWAVLAAAAIAAPVGALVALPAARMSGIELALATAGFAVMLERWIFLLPTFHVGSVGIRFFDQGNVTVDRLSLPGIGTLTTKGLLVALVAVFVGLHLLLTAVRRSRWGDQLLALRESPAACATIGIDPARTRIAAFAFSAALAAAGGALWAGTAGSVGAPNFGLFSSLPLLLLTVAGGVAASGGAVFAGIVLGGTPAVAAAFASLAGLLGLLPGTMGVTLGRNPDGVVADLRHRLALLLRSRGALAVVVALEAALAAAWLADVLAGWWYALVAFLVPFVVVRVLEPRPERALDPLDGIEARPLTEADIRRLDDALALAEVPRS